MNSRDLRLEISKIFIKNSLSTRQAAISEILTLFEQTEAALLKAVDEKVIEEDEEYPTNFAHPYYEYDCAEVDKRNELRAEQRKALAKLQEGEK